MKTLRTAFVLSVLGNLALLAWFVARQIAPASQAPTIPATGANPEPRVDVPGAAATASPFPLSEPPAFSWSQIESTNYSIYVANLRAIGCPERAIRDIVASEIAALYAPRRETLEQRAGGLAGDAAPAPLGARQTAELDLRRLATEQESLVSALLADPSEFVPAASSPARAANRPVTMPLAFQEIDPELFSLSDHQVALIKSLRERFLQQVGGDGQDPNDPAYRRRWQESQPESDELLSGMLGVNAYQNYQIAAHALQ